MESESVQHNLDTLTEQRVNLGPGLRVLGDLAVDTQDGPRKIELLAGDITKLPPEQKMDVCMVSAFPGMYSA